MSKEKDLVWLPIDLANKIKAMEANGEDYEQLITGYIDDSRKEVKNNLEMLDDDVLQYRGLMVKAKQEFKKAKDEQLQASYDLWEEFDKELPKTAEKVETLLSTLAPIKEATDELKDSLNGISLYQLKDLEEILENISGYLSSNSETGRILKFLVKNYSSPKS